MIHFERFIGHTFGDRYTVVSVIGEGESAVVFGAFDKETGETVALKMLHPECDASSEAAKRFESEMQLLSLFDHPNIVRLLDVSKGGEYRYFVMEYIEGITLKKHIISRGALEAEEILFLSRQILSALEHVHEKGVIHSDIKPQNIVIVGSGKIKLMDFGIAKTLSEQTGEIAQVAVGTVQYVSPEQAEGKPLDHLSDLYSFGVMLYEMATGILPFIDENANRIAAMHVNDTPFPPSLINEEVSAGLEAVILHAMEKSPADRFPSASALLWSLEHLDDYEVQKIHPLHEETTATPRLTKGDLPSAFAGILAALLISIVVGLGVLAGLFAAQNTDAPYVKVPSLEGKPFVSIEALGLDPDVYEIEIRFVARSARAGEILSQNPNGGKIVKCTDGEKCRLVLRVAKFALADTLPSVSALKEEDALICLGIYDCDVEVVYRPHALLPKGEVIAAVKTGKKDVLLYVSEGYRENTVPVPSFVGMDRDAAEALALETGLVCAFLSGEGDKITAQSLPAGALVDGASQTLILSTEK